MTIRVPTWVAATLLCLAPTAALPLEWGARAGLVYWRADAWAPGTPRDTQPTLDVGLALQLRGDIVAPTIFSYYGNVGYTYSTSSANGAQTAVARSLVYDLQANVLNHETSPLRLTGYASRMDSRAEQKLVGDQVGDQTSSIYGGNVAFSGAGKPSLVLGFNHRESNQTLDSVLDHEQSANGVNAAVTSSAGPLSLTADYQGNWSSGNYVSDEYQSHMAHVLGVTKFQGEADLVISDVYYRRVPTSTDAGAFGSEVNSFFASYRHGFVPGRQWTLGYSDIRAVTAVDATSGGQTLSTTEQTLSNSLRATHDTRLPAPEYFLRGMADFSTTSQQRTGAGSLSASGATVSLQLWWYHTESTDKSIAPGVKESWLYELAAGPVASYLRPAGAPVDVGYGGTAHGRIGIPLGPRRLNGFYEVGFGTNLYAQPGWSLTQSGNVDVTGPAGVGTYDLSLALSANRRSAPVLGEAASRSVTARGNYRWGRYSLLGQAQLTNGTLPGTSSFVGDGLFVPTGFATRQTSILAQAAVGLRSGLSAHIDGRFSESAGPGQPSNSGWDAFAGISYRYAAFDVSIDDQLSWYEAPGGRYSRNQIIFRISRAIGSRF